MQSLGMSVNFSSAAGPIDFLLDPLINGTSAKYHLIHKNENNNKTLRTKKKGKKKRVIQLQQIPL